MKVRIGIGLPDLPPSVDLGRLVGLFEDRGVDSLWLSEVVFGPHVDPVVGMTYALACTRRLKVGTGVMVLPGRHPVLVAKQLASLARLAPGRVLPVFGLHAARAAERSAFPVPAGQRGAVFDESLMLIRELLTRPTVSFHGQFFDVQDASVGFLPEPALDIWLGGSADAALKRIGRLADGWLASFVSPDDAAAGVAVIKAAAADAGREIDPEHYGVSVAVSFGRVSPRLLEVARRRKPDLPAEMFAPVGWDALAALVAEFTRAGVTKFVVRPAEPPADWPRFIDEFVGHLGSLQT